jgi:translation initiation factor IF-3
MLLTRHAQNANCAAHFILPETDQETTSIRRPFRATAVQKDGPQANRDIRAPRIQLIDAEGKNHGEIDTSAALAMAEEAGMDLVVIAGNAHNDELPVCKIVDLGRMKYQTQKKQAEARKKQKIVEIKEIKVRPGIDIHDYEVKMRSVRRFFEEGDKVKVTLRFRGREMAHQELGMKVLDKVKEDTLLIAKVESEPQVTQVTPIPF